MLFLRSFVPKLIKRKILKEGKINIHDDFSSLFFSFQLNGRDFMVYSPETSTIATKKSECMLSHFYI